MVTKSLGSILGLESEQGIGKGVFLGAKAPLELAHVKKK